MRPPCPPRADADHRTQSTTACRCRLSLKRRLLRATRALLAPAPSLPAFRRLRTQKPRRRVAPAFAQDTRCDLRPLHLETQLPITASAVVKSASIRGSAIATGSSRGRSLVTVAKTEVIFHPLIAVSRRVPKEGDDGARDLERERERVRVRA